MPDVTELEKVLTDFINSVDTLDFGSHHLTLHHSAEEFVTWCKINGNISQDGIDLLIKIFQSIPFGYCNVVHILEHIRKEHNYCG